MYLAQLLSCTLEFQLNFSQYIHVPSVEGSAEDTDTDREGRGDGDDHAGLFELLCQYAMEMFQFGEVLVLVPVLVEEKLLGATLVYTRGVSNVCNL